mmetsp:Transcript_42677/g.109921  ORF Transcript_42677/g.109921 Transcript_42677/m.109921 type:complete len:193 (-) Transcript_42677:2276-2854(-)
MAEASSDVSGSASGSVTDRHSDAEKRSVGSRRSGGTGSSFPFDEYDVFDGHKQRRRSSTSKEYIGDSMKCAENPFVEKLLEKYSDDPEVLFSDVVTKINRRNKMQKRVLMVTNQAVYNLDPVNFRQKRRIGYDKLAYISMSKFSDNFFVLHAPSEYDYLLVSARKAEIVDVIKKAYKKFKGAMELKVIYNNR